MALILPGGNALCLEPCCWVGLSCIFRISLRPFLPAIYLYYTQADLYLEGAEARGLGRSVR